MSNLTIMSKFHHNFSQAVFMANRTSLLPMLEIMGGFTWGGGLNPSNKVFNPTKILLQLS
jgi:hypothetical protein